MNAPKSMAMTLWCNGQWMDAADFQASPFDRAALLGLGLFETILARDGKPVFLDRHMDRLQRSAARLAWPVVFSNAGEIVCELLRRNELLDGRARIRLALTGGSGPVRDLTPGGDRMLWIAAFPAEEMSTTGAVNISPWPRNELSPLAGLKCASYAENVVALDHARKLGFSETLFFNTTDHLCEGAACNVFLVCGKTLLTPSLASGCLPGVTRAVLIELARQHGMDCEERDLTRIDLATADEVFLSSSIRGVVAVSRLGECELGHGPMTRQLAEWWAAAIRDCL